MAASTDASTDQPRHNISRPYELAAALRAIRREQNLTQAQLAGLSGTSRQWISEAENNKLPFGVTLVGAIASDNAAVNPVASARSTSSRAPA